MSPWYTSSFICLELNPRRAMLSSSFSVWNFLNAVRETFSMLWRGAVTGCQGHSAMKTRRCEHSVWLAFPQCLLFGFLPFAFSQESWLVPQRSGIAIKTEKPDSFPVSVLLHLKNSGALGGCSPNFEKCCCLIKTSGKVLQAFLIQPGLKPWACSVLSNVS